MLQTQLKSLLLAAYVACLVLVWSLRDVLDGFTLLLAGFVVTYCGIVVLSQLVSTLVVICHWRVADNLASLEESLETPVVDFETESEAT